MGYEFTGIVEVVEVKKSKNGRTYYRLNIPQDGSDRWHTSFDSKVVDLQGETIIFNAEKTKYGWNLKDYEVIAGQDVPVNTPTGSTSKLSSRSSKENAWIACQGLINRGIEVGYFKNILQALDWFAHVFPVLQAIYEGEQDLVEEKLQELALTYEEEPGDLEDEKRIPGEEG